ncbi:MAG: dTDP-4-dehydrorhamnose 3,5-epimerase [Nitrospirae bacterium]|nr:dTDP-4-dehydrorhamnose 3,5-epimerase [Nitrospirota bacterium]
MRVTETALPGVLLIEPQVFRDARGMFWETYHASRYAEAGIAQPFVQDNYSRSARHTLRGLHHQLRRPQGKLVWVIRGEVFDVAVDIRRGSSHFGRWIGLTLSEDRPAQVYIPPGFAHGFCVVSETADFAYKCTDFYDPSDERGIIWNDPDLGIAWPVSSPVLSPKDRGFRTLSDSLKTGR